MTSLPESDHEIISAYVDGELSSSRRAEVAARAAADPAFAQELAVAARLKAALEEAVPVPALALPATRPALRRFLPTAAAAALLAALIAGVAWMQLAGNGRDGHGAPVAWAVGTHQNWLASAGPVAVPAAAALAPRVPDLAANGLVVAHAELVRTPQGIPALVVGYLGSRGCRLTFVTASAQGGRLLVEREQGRPGVLAEEWRAGGFSYLLLAEGMSPVRFGLVAASVRRMTESEAPISPETRLALRRNRAESPPCAA